MSQLRGKLVKRSKNRTQITNGRKRSEEKPFLLITGMHRSGTSFLGRALNLSGVYLGGLEDLNSNDWSNQINKSDNLRGHWEHRKLLELQEKTLAFNNGTWDQPPTKDVIINEEIGREVSEHIRRLLSHPSLAAGFKDPRLLLSLDAWSKYLPDNHVIVGIFRHPLEVAQSLKTRSGFSYEKSLNLWRLYNRKLLYYLEKYNGFLLDFNWPKRRIFANIRVIANKLGTAENIDLSEWYSEDLIHCHTETIADDYKLRDDTLLLFSELQRRSENNNKVYIRRPPRSSSDLLQVITGLISDIQNQGKYFKKIQLEAEKEGKYFKTPRYRLALHVLQNITLGHQKTIQEKDNQIMQLNNSINIIETQLKQAVTDVDTLQKINVGHQKTIEEKDNQIMQLNESNSALETQLKHVINEVDTLQRINLGHQKTIESNQKSIEVLQNITLGHQKTIEEKDNQIMQLNESNKAADDQLEQAREEINTIRRIHLGHQKRPVWKNANKVEHEREQVK